MRQLKRYTGLYWLFLLQRFKILLEYRVNFIIGASSTVFLQAAGLLAIWVVMRQIPHLNGWTLDQLWLVYGLLTLAKSINHMFADNLWTLGWQYIRPGGFDRFLVRPINPLFHLLADRFCHDGIGNFLVGLALVVKAFGSLGIPWSLANVVYLAAAVTSGGLIFIALNLITAVSAFWIIESIPVTLAVFQTHEFAKYPLDIYRRSVSLLMTWAIPYGLASFYPASYLLGRDVGIMAWAGVPVAVGLLLLGYRFWQFGLRHYGSTGS
ncbi:MAG TPA: ABC-2 family transporter protein [Symbiobacteriaceae bacterium]|nr:ABC-2 family transporter protein [Symbiobacteriaceae bacterium]